MPIRRRLVALCLLAVPALFSAPAVRAAAPIEDEFLLREMKFVEKIADVGYFETARAARDRLKTVEGLTGPQINYLDLVQAKIDVAEILKEKNLAAREQSLGETVKFLEGVIDKLPKGSVLRAQATARLATAFIEVAEGFVKEMDSLDLEILGRIQKDLNPLQERRKKVAEMAQKAYGEAVTRARDIREDMVSLFDGLVSRMEMIDNPRQRSYYLKKLESVFVQIEAFDHAVAAMYPNYARTYDRGSTRRDELFLEGYWFNMDVTDFHSQAYGGDYIDYSSVMTYIRLGALKDEPADRVVPKLKAAAAKKAAETPEVVQSLTSEIPTPIEMMNANFTSKVIGKYRGKEAPIGQEVRPRCLYFFAEGWLEMARGAYALADQAKDEETRAAWLQHAGQMAATCEKALDEINKGNQSVVGPVSPFIQQLAEMEIQLPLLLLQATREHAVKKVDAAESYLSYARSVCGQMLLDEDPQRKAAAQRRMVVVRAVIDNLMPQLNDKLTPAEAIFEAEQVHKAYLSAKARDDKKAVIEELLTSMREKFLAAKSLLANARLSRQQRAEYTAKSWYYIGLASLYLDDNYTAFIANQYLLQSFPETRFPAQDFPAVERYRGFSAKNVVSAAYRQQQKTHAPFDRKLYAQGLIWRIRYDAQRDPSKSNDFYYVVGEQFLRAGDYVSACEWFAKTPEASKLYRLAWLQRGQAALKEALGYVTQAEKVEAQIAATETAVAQGQTGGPDPLLLRASAAKFRGEAKPWFEQAAESARTFLQVHEAFAQKHGGDLAKVPVQDRDIFSQEEKNKFAAYLLLMQIDYGGKNWAGVRQWAAKLDPQAIPEETRKDILPRSAMMQFLATLEGIDREKDPPAQVAAVLRKAEPALNEIGRYAGKEDSSAIQAIMLLGDRWLKLAQRAETEKLPETDEYKREAGRIFAQAIVVVDEDPNFARTVGRIFTEQKMYDKAEEIYDRALRVWDLPEKTPPMPTKAELQKAADQLYVQYLGQDKGTQMKELHLGLRDLIFPKEGDPLLWNAVAKIQEIFAYDDEERPDPSLPEKVPTTDLLNRLRAALIYKATLLQIKDNLILAKVDLGKWDEAMKLVDDVLAANPNNREMKLMKALVHVRRAAQAATLAQAEPDLKIAYDLCTLLSGSRKKEERFGKGSPGWWQSMALYYEARQAANLLDAQKGKEEGAKDMRRLRLWRSQAAKSREEGGNEEFVARADAVFNKYVAAGFQELTLDETAAQGLAERGEKSRELEKKKLEEEALRTQKERALRIDYISQPGQEAEAKDFFGKLAVNNPEELKAYWRIFPDKMKALAEKGVIEAMKVEPLSTPSPDTAPAPEAKSEAGTEGTAAPTGAAGGETKDEGAAPAP